MNKQTGFVTLYAIGALVVLCGVMSYGLYKQVQSNGVLKANAAQLEQAILDANRAYDDLSAERKKVEVITIDNLVLKEEVIKEKEVVKYKIREVIKNAPPENCLNVELDPAVICLLEGTCGDGPETREDIPAVIIDPRHERTADAR